MSDVTGNLGGESIRLRGMALEDTQFKVLQEIEDLVSLTKEMAGEEKSKKALDSKNINIFNKKTSEAGESAGRTGKALGRITDILNGAAGKAFSALSGAIGANIRIIRGFDSNIDDASYSIRALSRNFRGGADVIARFAADSVDQLQEQYQAFKKMSNISGVVSTDFENLRVMATNMNMTMDQYAGLMQENFINLRTGGNLVSKSMRGLSAAVNDLNNDDELGYIFNRLGIDASQYGKVILQQTALSRGLNKGMQTYSEGFAKAMQRSVISSMQLADAFGVQRSDMMDARRKAQEDVFFDRMYQNLTEVDPAVKDAMLELFTGLAGGDVEKAKKLTVSTVTGIPTDVYRDAMAAGGGEIIEAIKNGAQKIATDADAMPNVLDNIANLLDQHGQRFGSTVGEMGRFFLNQEVPLKDAFGMFFSAGRIFAGKKGLEGITDAINKGKDALDPKKRTDLDVMRDIQQQNIRMARYAAVANRSINTFGLTLAHSSQMIIGVMNAVVAESISAFSENADVKRAINAYRAEAEKLGRESQDIAAEFARENVEILTGVGARAVREAAQGGQPQGGSNAQPVSSTGAPLSNMVNVKTTTSGKIEKLKAGDIDNKVGQYNQGGATSPAVKQLLGVLAGSNDLTVTGINDAFAGRGSNTAHNKGLAVDFTLPAGEDYKKKRDEFYNLLVGTYGLDPNKDFKVFNEKDFPSGHATGAHMHVEFSEQGAAKFQNKFRGMFQQSPISSAPGGGSTTTSSTNNGNPTALSGSAADSGATGATALASAVNSSSITLGNNVNTRTSMVAIADETLLGKFDTLINRTDNLQTAFNNLASKLESATYS